MRSLLLSQVFIRLVLFAALLLGQRAVAHSPFGASTTVFIGDEVTVNVTLGLDAAMDLMQGSGLSAEQVSQARMQRVSRGYEGLPLTFAGRLFEVRHAGKVLEPAKIISQSDGMEVMFSVTYPRSPTGELEFHATCFDTVPDIAAGTFIAGDEEGRVIMTAMISRMLRGTTVSLPAPATPVTADGLPNAVVTANQVTATDPSPMAPIRPGFGQFLHLGIEHILFGFDHLLFLLALLAGVRSLKAMLVIITCFTLAHSVTLALAALDIVTLSPRIVEPIIAASIVVVGVENLVRRDHNADRYWLASAFGLLHGFGFAGALRETGVGLGGADIALPLFAFNLGVELGQLAVAALVVPVLLWLRNKTTVAPRVTMALSGVVIAISAWWFVQRVFLAGV